MKPRCIDCGKATCYSEVADAHYCKICDMWCEKACSNPKCSYCGERPEKPLNIKGNE